MAPAINSVADTAFLVVGLCFLVVAAIGLGVVPRDASMRDVPEG